MPPPHPPTNKEVHIKKSTRKHSGGGRQTDRPIRLPLLTNYQPPEVKTVQKKNKTKRLCTLNSFTRVEAGETHTRHAAEEPGEFEPRL